MATTTAFKGDGIKFSGSNGFIKTVSAATKITGDGIVALAEGVYLIDTVKSTGSGFPAPADGGAKITRGKFLFVDTGIQIKPAVGEIVYKLDLLDRGDMSEFTMQFSRDNIDVTTYEDAIRSYVSGKTDMQGKLKGVFKLGTTDDPTDGMLGDFIGMNLQNGQTSFDSFEQSSQLYVGLFYVNAPDKETGNKDADRLLVIAAFTLNGMSLGAAMGDAQAFESDFRFANKSIEGVEVKPAYYRIASVS